MSAGGDLSSTSKMHSRHGSGSSHGIHFPVDPQTGYRYEPATGPGASLDHGGTALPPLAEALQSDYGGLGPHASKTEQGYPSLNDPLYPPGNSYSNGGRHSQHHPSPLTSANPEAYSGHNFGMPGAAAAAAAAAAAPHTRSQSFSAPNNSAFYPHVNGSSTSSPGTSSRRGSATSQGRTYNFVSLPGVNAKKRPRRRFEEIERLYNCTHPGCTKAYGTLNHLNAHVTMQKHGPKRFPIEFKELRKAWRKKKKDRDDRDGRPEGLRGDHPDPRSAEGLHLPVPQAAYHQMHPSHMMQGPGSHNGSHVGHYPTYLPGPSSGHGPEHGYGNFDILGPQRGPFDTSSGIYPPSHALPPPGPPQGHSGMHGGYGYSSGHPQDVGFSHPPWSSMNHM